MKAYSTRQELEIEGLSEQREGCKRIVSASSVSLGSTFKPMHHSVKAHTDYESATKVELMCIRSPRRISRQCSTAVRLSLSPGMLTMCRFWH